jgi:hypothetical protein
MDLWLAGLGTPCRPLYGYLFMLAFKHKYKNKPSQSQGEGNNPAQN